MAKKKKTKTTKRSATGQEAYTSRNERRNPKGLSRTRWRCCS